ncbi:VQ motif-containing protein 10 [Cynara cardunculus var. scolymus]|uniref:VQ-like protein n=1 Tax=Cynara cardunculus var. scolymus TaxID=59895 RepID=A0A103YK58_CYNCS|nr:VQ motif-containing protein 10 [Cynara cardunculus var. scolymus]KVI10569.1 VQ-like protein [Cynara cardunculus var. scolymus]
MARSGRGNSVKVVIINTEYIQTDAMSFKSVVQRLTGKDSPPPSSPTNDELSHGGGCDGGGGGGGKSPMLKKGMSFRDLDKLLLELPSMDDIYQFCAD